MGPTAFNAAFEDKPAAIGQAARNTVKASRFFFMLSSIMR
jgi:hypothetical protein